MLLVTAIVVGACGDKKHTLLVEDGVLKMDGKPYTVASAEIDYARLPREYWANWSIPISMPISLQNMPLA